MFTFMRYLWLLARGTSAPGAALHFFNHSAASKNKKGRVLKRAFPGLHKKCTVWAPLHVERPDLLSIGPEAFLNVAVTIANGAMVSIGERTFVGPGVKFCTPAACNCSSSADALRFNSPASWATVVLAIQTLSMLGFK